MKLISSSLITPTIYKEGKQVIYYVEFTKLNVNGKLLLTTPVKVWHDKPMTVRLPLKVGEKLEIEAEYRTVSGGARK